MEKTKAEWGPTEGLKTEPSSECFDTGFLAWHRTQLANERTFLSWCRTSVSLLALGFVLTKFEAFLSHAMHGSGHAGAPKNSVEAIIVSGGAFLLSGFTILVGGIRFYMVRRHLRRGTAVFSVFPDVVVIVSVVVVIVLVLALFLPMLARM